VLLIEDNADIRAMLRRALEEAGFDVLAVPDGGAGLGAQRSEPARVVVTDLYMPGMEGIETIDALRHQYPDTRIVAISGGCSIGGVRADPLEVAREIGADAVLRKPFGADDLVAVIRRVLG